MTDPIKILIVEDEEIVAALAAGVARELTPNVEIATNGEDAKNAWLQSHHNLIVLDLHLPGISGEDFCRWLREHPLGGDTFVLICTGDSKVETFRRVLSLGANDYIPKPLQPKLMSIRLEVARHQVLENIKKQLLQAELVRNEKRFRLISENSRDLVCTHKEDGTLLYISPSSMNLLGRDPASLVGKSLDEFKTDPRAEPINLRAKSDEENGLLAETRIWEAKTTEGKPVWLETFSQINRERDGSITEIYSYSRDITEQKQEEAQLRILSVLGEENDTEGFLESMIKEIGERLDANVAIHIHGKAGERENYHLPQNTASPEIEKMHLELNKTTPHDKTLFQSTGASGVFNHIPGTEEYDAVVIEPILGSFGKPVGKITICRKKPLPESERTKAILKLCASKVGCVLEEHVTR